MTITVSRMVPRSAFHIEADRGLQLNLLDANHAPEALRLIEENRDALHDWIPKWSLSRSLSGARVLIDGLREDALQEKSFILGIWMEERLAGLAGLSDIDWTHRRARLQVFLGAEFQGRGLMTRCGEALLHHALDSLFVHRVEMHCPESQPKACALAERLGMRQEGRLKDAFWVRERFTDVLIYGKVRHP